MHKVDLLIIGAGPAGMSAAINAASEGLKTLVIDKSPLVGGQARMSTRIENVFGWGLGMTGAAMGEVSRSQLEIFGGHILLDTSADSLNYNPVKNVVWVNSVFQAKAVILAVGVTSFKPEEFVPYTENVHCGVDIVGRAVEPEQIHSIIGGGNSAGQAALFLAPNSRRIRLYVRRPLTETMSAYLIARIMRTRNISIHVEPELKVVGAGEKVFAINGRTTDQVFVFTGAKPHTDWLMASGVKRDERGYIHTGAEVGQHLALHTSFPGVFAVGDARHGSIKRVAVAAGEGAAVIHYIHQYLNK